jgi:hypothetical protein
MCLQHSSGFDGEQLPEAKRIDLAFLFDPMMAIHTSNVDALPHQITAVYESMLPRQHLRFVLADDPGAGKTIALEQLSRDTVEAVVWPMSEAAAVLLDRSLRLSEHETALEVGWLLAELEQPSRMSTPLSLATARSGIPSPLKSPATIAYGWQGCGWSGSAFDRNVRRDTE